MTEAQIEKKTSPSKAELSQLLRSLGASILTVPSLIEYYALKSNSDIRELSSITSTMRQLCTALIKLNAQNIEGHGDQLEIYLSEHQKNRMVEESSHFEKLPLNKSK